MKNAPYLFKTQDEMQEYNKQYVNDNLWGPIVEEILTKQCQKKGITYEDFMNEIEERAKNGEMDFERLQLFMWEKLNFDVSDLIEYNNKKK